MKKIKYWAIALAAVALPLGFASCGGDDDENELWKGELPNPKFESDAVMFNVNNNSDIESIELTASGNYIIMPSGNDAYQPQMAPARGEVTSRFFSKRSATRSYEEYGVFGEYKKIKDGVYDLIGYGTLTIENDSKVNLALDNGQDLNLDVTREKEMPSSSLNDRLCRTWYITGVKFKVYDRKDNVLFEKELSDVTIKDDFVEYIVMSKASTYISVDWDGDIDGYGKWKWDDEDLQVFRYSFIDDPDDTGLVKVSFDGDKCKFIETYYDDEWGEYEDELVRVEATISARSK